MVTAWRSATKSTQVKDILLLDQNKEGKIAWHVAVFGDCVGVYRNCAAGLNGSQ